MSLTTSVSWLRRAQEQSYAIGAFNANTLEQMEAIVLAAQEEQAPVIIQISQNAASYLGMGIPLTGLRFAAEMGRILAESVPVPVVLHFDHGSPVEIYQALSLGFTSVMFDGSDLPFAENIARTRELCAAAHAVGACFESELGEVPRSGVSPMEDSKLTCPAHVAEYVDCTGIDALAVSIGSVHALRKKEVALDLDLLDEIRNVTKIPLVLHGSSGVLDESLQQGIHRGLCKINVATQLNGAYTRALRQTLANYPDVIDPRKYLPSARNSMKEQVRERMRLFGVCGRAAV